MAADNTLIIDVEVGSLKTQLRESVKEMQSARAKFGEFSDQAITAAKNVAKVRDEIDAGNEAAKLFDPGARFQALTTAAQTAAGGVAAVQGAMALFGAESDDVGKALMRVQGAMALSQGLSQLKDIGKVGEQLKMTFKGVTQGMGNFKKALISTGIGILVAALGLLIANFDDVKKFVMNLFPGLGKLTDFVGGLVTAFTDLIGVTSAAERGLEKLAKTNARGNEDIESRIKMLTAQGGKEKEIHELKKKQSDNELNYLRESLKTKGSLSEEELKRFRELKNTKIVDDIAFNKQQADADKAAGEKSKQAADKVQKDNEAFNQKVIEAKQILHEANTKLKDKQEQEIIAIEDSYKEKSKKLKLAGLKDTGDLALAKQKEIDVVKDRYVKENTDKELAFQQEISAAKSEAMLASIKDADELAIITIQENYKKQYEVIDANEKYTAEQKLALKKILAEKEESELGTQKQAFELKLIDAEIQKITAEQSKANLSFQIQKDLIDKKEALLKQELDTGLITQDEYTKASEANTNARIELSKKEGQAKMDMAKAIGDSLGVVSDIIGKESVAGKAVAVAQALINTYLGIAAGVKLGFPAAIPAVLAAAATGFKSVKSIIATKIPVKGGGGGGGSVPSAPAVANMMPTVGNSPVTSIADVMQTKQAPIRAFVVESEVTSSQKRVSDIERRAGF